MQATINASRQATLSMDEQIARLRQKVMGSVLTRDDSRYEQTRRGWNLSINQYPALILVASDAADVAAGVQFARDNDMGIAVQSTGHGMLYPADDNLLIVTTLLSSVSIDPETQTARVGAGVIWNKVLNAAAEYGLAPLLGSSPNVGVIGYTLGGGMGWLARKYGLAADSVLAIEIVTPDGVQRRASTTENAELFWGLRGGGGNFGVVTAMEFKLYPVKTIYGGSITYPAENATDVLRFFSSWIETVPDELTASAVLVKFPDLPQVPEPMRGKKLISLEAAYVGDAADGAALIQQWLDWRMPIMNSFAEMPFTEVAKISNDPVEPLPSYSSGELLDDLSDDVIDVIVKFATDDRSPMIFNEIRHGQGAIASADRTANAIGNRDAKLYLRMGGVAPTSEVYQYMDAYVGEYKQALRPYLQGGMYLNFMDGGEASTRSRDAYTAGTYRRLGALKATYDPQNLFRYSFTIPAVEADK